MYQNGQYKEPRDQLAVAVMMLHLNLGNCARDWPGFAKMLTKMRCAVSTCCRGVRWTSIQRSSWMRRRSSGLEELRAGGGPPRRCAGGAPGWRSPPRLPYIYLHNHAGGIWTAPNPWPVAAGAGVVRQRGIIARHRQPPPTTIHPPSPFHPPFSTAPYPWPVAAGAGVVHQRGIKAHSFISGARAQLLPRGTRIVAHCTSSL